MSCSEDDASAVAEPPIVYRVTHGRHGDGHCAAHDTDLVLAVGLHGPGEVTVTDGLEDLDHLGQRANHHTGDDDAHRDRSQATQGDQDEDGGASRLVGGLGLVRPAERTLVLQRDECVQGRCQLLHHGGELGAAQGPHAIEVVVGAQRQQLVMHQRVVGLPRGVELRDLLLTLGERHVDGRLVLREGVVGLLLVVLDLRELLGHGRGVHSEHMVQAVDASLVDPGAEVVQGGQTHDVASVHSLGGLVGLAQGADADEPGARQMRVQCRHQMRPKQVARGLAGDYADGNLPPDHVSARSRGCSPAEIR